MWLHSFHFHVLFLLINISLVINADEHGSDIVSERLSRKRLLDSEFTDTETKKNKESTMFSDVIKNISKVNNALQDLIKNYEQLQKIYRVDSIEATELSSDSELDEYFKETEKKIRKKNRNGESDTEEWSTSKKDFPATKMLLSEEKETATENLITSDDEEKPSPTEKFSNVEKEYELDKVEEDDDIETSGISSTMIILEELNESITEKIETDKDQYNSDEKRVPDIFLDDDVVKRLNTSTTNTNETDIYNRNKNEEMEDSSNSFFDDDVKIFNNITANPNEKLDILNEKGEMEDTSNSFSDDVVKETNATTAEPNKMDMSNKIDQKEEANGEISSTEENEETHRTTAKEVDENLSSSKTTSTKYVERIIRSEIFDENDIWTEIAKKTPIKLNISESIEEGNSLELTEDEAETQTIRKAYGDACLKVVVRKCFKACKKTNKLVCKVHKCKGTFKKDFLENSKTACKKAFNYNQPTDKMPNNDIIPAPSGNVSSLMVYVRQTQGNMTGNNVSIDTTRKGLESCYPFIKPIAPNANVTTVNRDGTLQLNILRDRYEKECQRASASLCVAACKEASDATCREACATRKVKAYSKHCKKQCKSAYRYTKHKVKKSSTETEESSDDSSSDSSDSSDSDDSDDSDEGDDSDDDDDDKDGKKKKKDKDETKKLR